MNDDTKEEAHAGSFGLRLAFKSTGIERKELNNLMTGTILSLGKDIDDYGKTLIGHIKAFISVPGGSLRINMVDLKIGPGTDDRLPEGNISEGEIRLMVAAIGISDKELKRLSQKSLEPMSRMLRLEVQTHEH